MNYVFLLTGGNLDDRPGNLRRAAELLEKEVGAIISRSSVFETEAWGITDQAPFLNQVLHLSTALSSTELLPAILQIEQVLGRKRVQKMGPRIIDIDILFYNDEVISTDNLTVPHPEIANRRFVLAPLAEIAPDYIHPVLRKSIKEMWELCPDKLAVRKFELE